MSVKTIPYPAYLKQVPQQGKHILAQQEDNQLIVYQAFNPNIANYAVEQQTFGGNHYSFSRMSWIKPNFLWMMYRCGWASKENQERVLAIWIKKTDFDEILSLAVHSSYQSEMYESKEAWKTELSKKPVRLQWDPDHDPFGQKQDRKAIQLGLKGKILSRFCNEMIQQVIDVTPFVLEQKQILKDRGVSALVVPEEHVYVPNNTDIKKNIGLHTTKYK